MRVNMEFIKDIVGSIAITLQEMQDNKGGSDGLYESAKQRRGDSFDEGYKYAVDMIKSANESM